MNVEKNVELVLNGDGAPKFRGIVHLVIWIGVGRGLLGNGIVGILNGMGCLGKGAKFVFDININLIFKKSRCEVSWFWSFRL